MPIAAWDHSPERDILADLREVRRRMEEESVGLRPEPGPVEILISHPRYGEIVRRHEAGLPQDDNPVIVSLVVEGLSRLR